MPFKKRLMKDELGKTGLEYPVQPGAQCEDPSKRRTLILLLGLAAATSAAALGLLGRTEKERTPPTPSVEDPVSPVQPEDSAERQESPVIPEDERTGKNILLMLPTNEDGKCCSSDSENTRWIANFIEGMPENTRVILVASLDVDRNCFEQLAKEYSNVTLVGTVLDTPSSCVFHHMRYPQDIFFPTGKTDKDGKIELIVSSLDKRLLELRFMSTIEKQEAQGITKPEIDVCEAMRFLGDDLLVEEHDSRFVGISLPISCVGGDLQIIRLPNGRTGCLLGKLNLANMMTAIMYEKEYPEKGMIPNLALTKDAIALIKELYCRALGVDECILLDEEEVANNSETATYTEMAYGSTFFHSDMIVKTASSPKSPSQQLAFVTNVPSLLGTAISTNTYKTDIPYLKRVRKQFEDLGYKIIDLPCGPWPTMGYTNSVMFTRNGKKYVAVPQYGIEKDQRAVETFENEGFEVIKVDMSFINEMGERKKDTGSLHCRTVVLN